MFIRGDGCKNGVVMCYCRKTGLLNNDIRSSLMDQDFLHNIMCVRGFQGSYKGQYDTYRAVLTL